MIFANFLFFVSALLTVASAILIAMTKNIIHSCVYLLGCLIGMAGLYVTLGADFIAAVQILVYVGGVVILMLFAVMLTGGQEFIKFKLGKHPIPIMGNKKSFLIAIFSALVLALTLVKMIFSMGRVIDVTPNYPFESTVEKIGMLLVTDHILAFEVISVLLLGALIGAAIIARPLSQVTKIKED